METRDEILRLATAQILIHQVGHRDQGLVALRGTALIGVAAGIGVTQPDAGYKVRRL